MGRIADRVAILIAAVTALFIAVLLLPTAALLFYPREVETPIVPMISVEKAGEIAVAEVKRREGWSGKADEPWLVDPYRIIIPVRPGIGSTADFRAVTMNRDGTIVSYKAHIEPPRK
jgi:hypothetical protein